jgi:general secretion pathway protein A
MKTLVKMGLVLLCLAITNGSFAAAPPDAEQTAKLLALLLDSGRVVLAKNQALINDPAKGDKGFTSAVFEAQVVEEFKKRSGVDFAQLSGVPEKAKPLLKTLMAVGKEVIDEKQSVINEKGKGYKNVIPATWGTWTGEKFTQKTGVLLKQTALDYRNPKNAPDGFETKVLQKFAEPSYPREGEKVISETEGGKFRLMLPLYQKKGCLVCHGKPKGEMDISGYKKEGHVEGDPAGAISVALPAGK